MKKIPGRMFVFASLMLLLSATTFSQDLLKKNISVNITSQRLDHALEIISNTGNFYFSYNSSILKPDSIISINATALPLQLVLEKIFGNHFEFRQSGKYIILRRAPLKIKLVTTAGVSEDKFFIVSGEVIDDHTGQRISDASVYEKDRLTIANTNNNGFFRLKLKSKYNTAAISVSKEYYEDTTVHIRPRYNQTLTITLVPSDITQRTTIIGPHGFVAPETINVSIPINDSTKRIYTYIKQDSFIVERSTLGKWFVSSRQKLQSINLKNFFVPRPYQVSIIPGLSTNGKLNSQVINNFSLNIFGGYAGGTNGVEIGGLFNIDKKDAKYVQVGGLFNMVGENMTGAQIAGISNTTFAAVSGAQVAGIYNHGGSDLQGAQIAGVVNFTNHKTSGAQIAGVANISSREVKGVQIAGVFNYTRRLKGLQIGLINVSDTSSGLSIGLINIVFKGYHKLSLYTNELIDFNAAFKTGNPRLYSIFLGGIHTRPDEKLWSYGYGLGSELINKRKFGLNLELTAQQLQRGSWDHYNILSRANLLFNYKFGKNFSAFISPAYNVFVTNQHVNVPGYKQNVPPSGYKVHSYSNDVTGWIGWSAGVNIF